ncbi:DUF6886 family protein [Paenibacillus endoradicis]|uniref:DUF6886 family protein n=1 Tax=Paenibacillus endoradicis TaxID=2972487 RepID=UPI002158AAB1|nr:DUF6886 family protein [Paenibacillus endoradicis]MCR8656705.1 hypothetical protein [Paenibacillus endoradicis]
MKLYHFSEEEQISLFKPRVKENRKDMAPVVWAIDGEHQFTFFFPRSCPRIVYTKSDRITEQDQMRFFGTTNADVVVTVETSWYMKIMNTPLIRYEMPTDTFSLFDETAGYHISYEEVKPIGTTIINNGLERLMNMNIEVRFTPDLNTIRNELLESSINDFGIHKFDNAIRTIK